MVGHSDKDSKPVNNFKNFFIF